MRCKFGAVGALAIVALMCLGTSVGSPFSTSHGTNATAVATHHEVPGMGASPSHSLVSVSPGGATPVWSNLSIPDSKSPPPRISGAMTWDETASLGVLFGGEYLNDSTGHYVYYNDTWTFLGGKWTNMTTAHSPSARFGMGLASFPAAREIVLFGGRDSKGQVLNDTWVWTPTGGWTNVTPVHSPPRTFWGSMTYDDATGSILLFGGYAYDSVYMNDTWSFNAGVWSQLSPTVSPAPRADQEMTYDSADSEVVLFGGLGAEDYNDTWTFAGNTWTQVASANHPSARVGPGIAYDSATGDVVLYGGNTAGGDYYSTWLFSGGTWTQYNLTNDPPNPTNPWGQFFYDPTDNYVLLFYEVDGSGPDVQSWALTISTTSTPLQATLSAAPDSITLGQSTNFTTDASGGTGIYTYAYSTLPPSCVSHNLSRIECTPSSVGSFVVGVNVTDTASNQAAATASLLVSASPVTLTATLAADPSTVEVNHSTTLTVSTGGVPVNELTYIFTALPPGCASADTAVLTCTPNATGAFVPRVEVHDSFGHFANATTSLTVTATSPNTPGSSLGSLGLWIVIALVVLVAIVLIVVLARRRRKAAPPAAGASPPPPGAPPPPP